MKTEIPFIKAGFDEGNADGHIFGLCKNKFFPKYNPEYVIEIIDKNFYDKMLYKNFEIVAKSQNRKALQDYKKSL